MTTGEKIRSMRKAKGLTQKQVADRCNMADSAIRKYESGKITPKIETLQKIAVALDTIPYTLLDDSLPKIHTPSEKEKEDLEYLKSISIDAPEDSFPHGTSLPEQVNRQKMNDAFDKMNPVGQARAVEQVERLATIRMNQKPHSKEEPPAASEPGENAEGSTKKPAP